MENNQSQKFYDMIVADPPWERNQKGNWGAGKHYELMKIKEIIDMPIKDLAADNSVLWLWVTNSTIEDGYKVLRNWGYEPKSILTWFKFPPQIGLGVYLRNSSEHVLLGVRGKMPIFCKNQGSWFIAPTAQHSSKPREAFCIFERCYPVKNKLELFARTRQPGWDVWGNEIDSDIIIPGYPVPKYSDKVNNNGNEV